MTVKQAKRLINYYGSDILRAKGMKLEKRFLQHGTVTVFEHSLAVTILCVRIADWLPIRADRSTLIRGALLHDYFLYDWHSPDKSHRLHGFYHAKRAWKNAKRDFALNAIEQNMILSHMFPINLVLPRYRESVILCIADKLCATKETAQGLFGRRKTKKE